MLENYTMCEQTGERAGVFLNTLDPQEGKKTSGKRGFFMVPLSEHCSPQVPGGQRKNQATLRLQTVTKREHGLGLGLRQRNLVRAVEFLNCLIFKIQFFLPWSLLLIQLYTSYKPDKSHVNTTAMTSRDFIRP